MSRITLRHRSIILMLSLALLLSGMTVPVASAADVPKISVEELRAMLGNPDLIIIDVRIEHDWNTSASKIPGAVWENFKEADTWAKKYPKDKRIVLYCD